jgi:hypothetical protein
MNDRFAKIGAFVFVVVFGFVTAVTATTCHRENAQAPAAKDPGPLHGESPMFTVVPMKVCTSAFGPFCDEWEWCGSSAPKVSTPQKLWNAYAAQGKDGPVLVCEWRDKKDER